MKPHKYQTHYIFSHVKTSQLLPLVFVGCVHLLRRFQHRVEFVNCIPKIAAQMLIIFRLRDHMGVWRNKCHQNSPVRKIMKFHFIQGQVQEVRTFLEVSEMCHRPMQTRLLLMSVFPRCKCSNRNC